MKGALLLIFVLVIAMITAISIASPQLARIAADHAAQPVSAAELALRSRTTPVAGERGGVVGWALALAFLVFLVIAGYLAYLYLGAEFLKQRRLFQRKPPRRRPFTGAPSLTIGPPAMRAPNIQRVPELPEWSGADEIR